ncbi:MAG TPA: hypothetical protein VHN11_09440 [Xanthobacteraceae bacterium]|jgi:hypothetical protein|nr:hypothetical protein [Xanthobacteraceae bacterium]
MYRALSAAVLLSGALLLSACAGADFDPQDKIADILPDFGKKKPLPGDRKAVFPEGVPGVPQGVPPELMKGYQAQEAAAAQAAAEAAQAAQAEAAKPKPKKVAAKPKPAPAAQPAANRSAGWPAADQGPPPDQSAWPAPSAAQPSVQSAWPTPGPAIPQGR